MLGPNIKVLKYCLSYKSKSVVKIILKLFKIKLITMTGIRLIIRTTCNMVQKTDNLGYNSMVSCSRLPTSATFYQDAAGHQLRGTTVERTVGISIASNGGGLQAHQITQPLFLLSQDAYGLFVFYLFCYSFFPLSALNVVELK